ncbi:MAG TPA: tRNA pseudouridine(55) synthase TruB [Stellaceae bacterium]|nr:tRNA pseudouridine(55) synthase TruB [Stellaceae bacterium]
MPAERGPSGWLVLDKPSGITSNRVVERVRRTAGAKAGHAGTLDPLATGVLPIAVGEATKTIAYAMAATKRYRFRICWGVARDSDDADGEITGESAARPERTAIETMLPNFTGTILQRPPAYSAIKIGGRRAYALARAGLAPAPAARPAEILSLCLTDIPDRDHADCEAVVGKGVYIRSLARDLAVALGTLGHVAVLRRLSVGCFTEAQAISLECVENKQHILAARGPLLPIEAGLDGIPALALAAAEAARLRCGQRLALRELGGALPACVVAGAVVGAWHDDALVAMARVEAGWLRPLRVMNW